MTTRPLVTRIFRRSSRAHWPSRAVVAIVTAVTVVAVAAATAAIVNAVSPNHAFASGGQAVGAPFRDHPVVITLPHRPESYLGTYAYGLPRSYAPIEAVTATTGAHLDVAPYYSGWLEPFQTAFAIEAAAHGAVPLVQIEPRSASLAAIAAGDYDAYLESYANAVARYGARTGHGVIIGFAHEPNGSWYPWGNRHVSPATWVAAWRHIVTVFRRQGADDVTWLWTINIIATKAGIPSPVRWWPGSSFVTWVGIDGYYLKPSWTFASLFGPTISAVRALTFGPILIAETGAAVAQRAKVSDLFAGIRAYGLLGFVWFDAKRVQDWRLSGRAAIAAFRQGAATFDWPAS